MNWKLVMAQLVLMLVLSGPAQAATMSAGQDPVGEQSPEPFDQGPCARSTLAQLQHNRQRTNFALSSGRRDSAEVRSMVLFERKMDLELMCARLDFSLSNGSGNALGLRR